MRTTVTPHIHWIVVNLKVMRFETGWTDYGAMGLGVVSLGPNCATEWGTKADKHWMAYESK